MSKVTDCARALGQAIVDSEEYKAMQITEKTAMNDPAVAAAMSRYLEAKDGMHTAMSAGNADEIARFSQEITGEVEQSGGCTGNCASCGGCH